FENRSPAVRACAAAPARPRALLASGHAVDSLPGPRVLPSRSRQHTPFPDSSAFSPQEHHPRPSAVFYPVSLPLQTVRPLRSFRSAMMIPRPLTVVLGAVLLVGWVGLTSAEDWPGWRGADRSGVSPEKGLLKEWPKEGPKLLWKASGIGAGYSSPAVA